MYIEPSLVTNTQRSESGEPSMRVLNDPAVTSKLFATLDARTRNACQDTATAQINAALSIVSRLVGVALHRAAHRAA